MDPLLDFIRDDPVRPEIPIEFRVAQNRFVAAHINDNIEAMVCVSLQREIPATVSELGDTDLAPTCAVFYTIWSYQTGAATNLLLDILEEIRLRYPTITRFVTLSPKTKVAHRFHTRNGAEIYRENDDTINYEYYV